MEPCFVLFIFSPRDAVASLPQRRKHNSIPSRLVRLAQVQDGKLRLVLPRIVIGTSARHSAMTRMDGQMVQMIVNHRQTRVNAMAYAPAPLHKPHSTQWTHSLAEEKPEVTGSVARVVVCHVRYIPRRDAIHREVVQPCMADVRSERTRARAVAASRCTAVEVALRAALRTRTTCGEHLSTFPSWVGSGDTCGNSDHEPCMCCARSSGPRLTRVD